MYILGFLNYLIVPLMASSVFKDVFFIHCLQMEIILFILTVSFSSNILTLVVEGGLRHSVSGGWSFLRCLRQECSHGWGSLSQTSVQVH